VHQYTKCAEIDKPGDSGDIPLSLRGDKHPNMGMGVSNKSLPGAAP